MSKVPVEHQIKAIEYAIKQSHFPDRIVEALEAAVRTISWIRDNPETMRYAIELFKDKRTQAVRDAFPKAELEEIRTGARRQHAQEVEEVSGGAGEDW